MTRSRYTKYERQGSIRSMLAPVTKRIHMPRSTAARVVVYAMGIVVLVEVGVLIQDTSFGTAAVLLYGLLALVFRIRSDQTFKLALVALVYIMLLTVLKKDALAQSFAQYAFLFLAIGVTSLLFEQRSEQNAPTGQTHAAHAKTVRIITRKL